jgi:putative copper export protein
VTGAFIPVLQQWLLFCGAAIAVGCVAWGVVVAPRTATMIDGTDLPELRRIEGRVASLGAATALGLIAVWGLRGVVQLVDFRDPFVPVWEDISLLLSMTWGKVWIAQGAVLPALALAFWRARAKHGTSGSALSGAWKIAAVLALLLTATLAMSSHAMGVATARPLLVTADALHSLAAGIWIGSLGLILATGHSSRSLFAAQIRSFSPMALVSVSTLVAMGVILSWTHVGTVANLWATPYGRTLSAKVGVAGLVFGLGFVNWRKGVPVADSPEGEAALRRRAASEVALAGGVLLLTALLVHTTKP